MDSFNIRMPRELHADLAKLASQDSRSLNNFLNKILGEYVKENPPKPTTRID